MASRDVVVLNETVSRLEVAQAGDTYNFPRSVTVAGDSSSTGAVNAQKVNVGGNTASAVGRVKVNAIEFADGTVASTGTVVTGSQNIDSVLGLGNTTTREMVAGRFGVAATDFALPIPAANIVDHDFFDNTQDSAWIDQCADKSWENEHIASGKQYLAASYANDAAALAANPSIVNGDVYYTGSVFNEYGVGVTTRAGSRKFPMRGVATAEATRVIIWDITSGQPEMWMVFNATAWGAIWSSSTSVSFNASYLAVGDSAAALNRISFVKDRFHQITSGGTFLSNNGGTIKDRNTTGSQWINIHPLVKIVNNTVNSVAITYLPDAPLDAYGMRVPTIAVGTAGDGVNGGSIIRHDGTVVHFGDLQSISRVEFISDTTLAVTLSYFPNIRYYDARNGGTNFINEVTGSASSIPFPTSGNNKRLVNNCKVTSSTTGVQLWAYNPTTPANGMVAYLTNAYNTGWMVGDIQACLVATATNTIADKSVKGIALTSTTPITTAVATSATLLSFKDTGGSITATLGATVANGHITWWEKVGTVWHQYVSVISAAGASTATGYIDGVSSTAVPIVNVAIAGGTGLTILTNIELTQVRPSVTVSTPEQIRHMYETERKLFEPNAQALLPHSTSPAVVDLKPDPKSGMYVVENGAAAKGSSSNFTAVFKDLARVDSAATGATIATPVTTLSGNRVLAPAVDIGSELSTIKTVHNRRRVLLDFNVVVNGKFSTASGWTFGGGWSLDAANNRAAQTLTTAWSEVNRVTTLKANTIYRVSFDIPTFTLSGGTGVRAMLGGVGGVYQTAATTGVPVSELITTGSTPPTSIGVESKNVLCSIDNFFVRESTDTLPPGFKPTKVWAGGMLQEEGTDYDVTFDGFLYGISFFIEPATNVQVEGGVYLR